MKVFITGVFRSGTTLVLQILNVSQNISITYDTIQFMRFCYKRYGKVKVKKEDAIKMVRDVSIRLKKREQKELNTKRIEEVIESQKGELSYGFLYDEMMKIYVNNENWGDRTTLEWRNATDLLKMFDDMYIIHVIRDPRDVITSWKPYTVAPGNDYLDAISNCYDSMKYALQNQDKFPRRYRAVKFEEFLDDPEKETRSLCDFLGLAFDRRMIDISNFQSKMGGRWDPNKHSSFKDKITTISKKPKGRWRKHLSEEDLILTELTTIDLMKRFGYAPSEMNWSIKEIKNALAHLSTSSLATESVMNIIKNGKGVQRYPQDPLDNKNWGKIEQ